MKDDEMMLFHPGLCTMMGASMGGGPWITQTWRGKLSRPEGAGDVSLQIVMNENSTVW
jgi:hypothetical protein